MIPKANAVAPDFSPRQGEAALGMRAVSVGSVGSVGASAVGDPSRAPSFADLGALSGSGLLRAGARATRGIARLTDAQLALLLGGVLFAVTAWPLLLSEVPPLQDLPNHLAAITVIEHPERYPDFVSNGFLKTNTALFAWLYFVGKVVGLNLAARLFTALVIAANAFILPRFVLELTGSRRKLVVASLFLWPMTHNWFVSKGMLDFALGVPLSLLTLMLVDAQRKAKAWSWWRAAAIGAAATLTWYAHVFALMVVHLLVGIHALTHATAEGRRTPRERLRELRLFAPLLPGTLLVAVSLWQHVTEPAGPMYGYLRLSQQIPPWEMAYNLWAEWLWGFTRLSITSFVVAVGLLWIAVARFRTKVPFFGPLAMIVMLGAYMAIPYVATNWFHVNSRMIPYLWVGALLRVPDRLPRKAITLLLVSAGLYSVGMGIDYVRLERDRQKFLAGIAAVPEGAHLLPLVFKRQLTSENTRSLMHAWGFYVVAKQTDAPLLFAHSRSFPVMYREPPPVRWNHLVLETFAPSMGSPGWMCGALRAGGVVIDCDAEWRHAWRDFWADALPRYDHVLLWEAPPEVLALVPSEYRASFRSDDLVILERHGDAIASP